MCSNILQTKIKNFIKCISQGGTVVQWMALLPSSEKVQGSNLSSSLISVHVLTVHAWLFSRHSSFHLQPKNMLVRQMDQSKLTLGVRVNSCLCLWVSPAVVWRPIQGGPPHLTP